VGDALLDIETAASGSSLPKLANENMDSVLPLSSHYKPSSSTTGEISSTSIDSERLKAQATPAVRKLAKEYDIDLGLVQPSGPKGRITKEDVLLFVQKGNRPRVSLDGPSFESKPVATASVARSEPVRPTLPPPSQTGDQRVPVRGVQRLMAKSMTAALQVPHLTYCDEVAFDRMRALRADLKAQFAKNGVKISYMPLLIKATSLALQQFPMLNASVSSDASEMVYHAHHHVGMAMDTPRGLLVPVIRHVQHKSIFEIALDLAQLQVRSACAACCLLPIAW
jgi:2-oxoisovalerate dehydrogenase E2 component (dihydrolipoyl transacylase)